MKKSILVVIKGVLLLFWIATNLNAKGQTNENNGSIDTYVWTKLLEPSQMLRTDLGFSSYSFDKETRRVYTLHQSTSSIISLHIDSLTYSSIPISGIPITFRNQIYNPANKTIQFLRVGPDNIYQVSVNGGPVTQLASGSYSTEHHGSSTLFNGVTGQPALIFGYGLYRVRNALHEVSGNSWATRIPNSSNQPYKRLAGAVLPNSDYTKAYIIDGAGNQSGSQTEKSCSIPNGKGWASDVGVWCWLRDIWEIDLSNWTMRNILPVNSDFPVTGKFGYDYDSNTFYSFGGYEPAPVYRQASATYSDDSLRVFTPGVHSGWTTVRQIGDIPSIEVGYSSIYDSREKRFLMMSSQGIWELRKVIEELPSNQELIEFTLPIIVSDKAQNAYVLTIGTAADALEGNDRQYNIFAPPPPPDGVFDARILYDGESYFTFIKPVIDEVRIWQMRVSPESGQAPVTLNWDPEQLPSTGFFYLNDDLTGELINVDMRTVNSYSITNSAIELLRITYTLQADVSVSYTKNWNLVGLPVQQAHDSYQDIFTNAYDKSMYEFNRTYKFAESLTHGTGYWVKLSDATEVNYSGKPVGELHLSLNHNWNLISSGTTRSVLLDPDGILVAGSLYGFNGVYTAATTLEPGRGYWVAASKSGSIQVIPYADTIEKLFDIADASVLAGAHRFEIHSYSGVMQQLYFDASISGDDHPLRYALPPVPPQGQLDVRIEGDRWLAEESTIRVHIQPSSEDLTWVVLSPEGDLASDYVVMLYNFSGLVDQRVVESGQKMLLDPEITHIDILLRDVDDEVELATTFALSQNFPNPFNPSTTIRYSLPEASHVLLEVYTAAGQRVAVLASGEQRAGWHTASFDGSALASGVYIYRLEAGGFVQTRKLMLIK
jgi:hypothetical protein